MDFFKFSLLALQIDDDSLQYPEVWQIAELGPALSYSSPHEKDAIACYPPKIVCSSNEIGGGVCTLLHHFEGSKMDR